MYPRNAASPERIAVGAVVLIADGTVQTSAVSITVVPQGGTTAAGGGTTSYEQGVVFYLPTQAETNYSSFIVTAYKASCIPVSVTVVTSASATAGKVVLSGETHTSAVIPTVTTLTGHTAQTGDSFARIGAAGAGLTNIGTIATCTNLTNLPAAAALEATLTAMKGATFTGATDSLEALRDRGDAAWVTATGFATPTNITAGTITTVTNVTNAPTAGDLTATMKTSVTTAATAATPTAAAVTAGVTVTTNSDKTGYALATGGVGSGAIAAAELNSIADAVLDRNMASGVDSGTDSTVVRTPRQALRALRNKVAIAGGVATVRKEDDATASWTAAIATTAGNPISSSDPT